MSNSKYKIIEYVIDPVRVSVGEVPHGKVIKTFKGYGSAREADEACNKLNEKAIKKHKKGKVLKGYFVKGELDIGITEIVDKSEQNMP